MKKFLGILLAVLLVFTAVSCSFFMEEKNNNSGSLVSFRLSGKGTKDDEKPIDEYITYGESTVKYGSWTDMTWDIWYYVTTDSNVKLFTTPSEVHKSIANDSENHGGWKNYHSTPFIVEKGYHVWAYCENIKTTDSDSPVESYMFKGIAEEEVKKTKTIITIEPKIDEKVAFEDGTKGSLKIKKLVYKMSKDQFESLTSESDIKKLKVTIKVGDKTYSTETDITNTDYVYGYAEFDPIEITGIEVSKGGTSPSDIVVEFVGLTENGTVSKECTPSNLFDMSSPTDSAVEVYILNNLETELESLVVENKTIGVATVYINTTDTDMFPYGEYDRRASDVFRVVALEDGNSACINAPTSGGYSAKLEYAVNDEAFKDYSFGSRISLNKAGDAVYFRAKTSNTKFSGSGQGTCYSINSDKNIAVKGNIMYLLDKTGKKTDVPDYAFRQLFSGCSTLIDASGLLLPGTTLGELCYDEMFAQCHNLTSVPVLPAGITFANGQKQSGVDHGSCRSMFAFCTSLTDVPANMLPSTTLNECCYSNMFKGCINLKNAPVLPATTLYTYCYREMFSGCTNLETITVNFTNWNVTYATYNWVDGCPADLSTNYQFSSSGTFHCPTELPEEYSTSKIPSGSGWTWTVVHDVN